MKKRIYILPVLLFVLSSFMNFFFLHITDYRLPVKVVRISRVPSFLTNCTVLKRRSFVPSDFTGTFKSVVRRTDDDVLEEEEEDDIVLEEEEDILGNKICY
jgi:hypothetical protein